MAKSRLPKFYQCSVQERLNILKLNGIINSDTFKLLKLQKQIISLDQADKMIENVIGVFGLSIGLALNFLINNKEYIIPMAVEEPSIIAAASSGSKLSLTCGGVTSASTDPILIGQIQIVDIKDSTKAQRDIIQNKNEIIKLANLLHPKMVARGGGVKDLEVIIHPASSHKGDMVIVHLLVDTRDAMGANLVNSMCEGVSSLIEKISRGKVALRILSNLADRSLVNASAKFKLESLRGKGFSGEDVAEGIVFASEFAAIDPYRAATNNKGIMNGIDAVALATGNDWRALEAAAHAYASRGKRYTSLTKWFINDNGELEGRIEIPIKVGIVGGPLQSNPAVKISHEILGIKSAKELAEIMGAVGLIQNFSALKALGTEGVQRGHMTLHARSVAMAAGATPDIFNLVVEELISSNEIKIWKAKELIEYIRNRPIEVPVSKQTKIESSHLSFGYGKVILFGEHAVVYGSHAIAAPIPMAIEAKVERANDLDGLHLLIPRWGIEETIRKEDKHKYSIYSALIIILDSLGLSNENMRMEIFPHIPLAMGLGSSAALAVSIIRALSAHYKLNLSDDDINQLAYQSEALIHGTTSGLDNTLATFGKIILYKNSKQPTIKPLNIPKSIPFVIGLTGTESLTAKMVAKVRQSWSNNPSRYEGLFSEIDALSIEAANALENMDLPHLGELMNINQGFLNALQVSSKEIEEINEIAKLNGALGAKLTGAGGGGAILALCPDHPEDIVRAIQKAGYEAMVVNISSKEDL